MRLYLTILLLLLGITPLWPASCGIHWPGWEVSTEEMSSSLKYPITNMLDGDPKTAWVFHKEWIETINPKDSFMLNEMNTRFNHGIDKSIGFNALEGKTFICDGIGIINGYAKNRKIYLQNNRITKITLHCNGQDADWKKTYSLKETTILQYLPIPHLRIGSFRIEIDDVIAGKDDDLCISELVLYHNKKPVSWNLTPTVLSTPMIEECDGIPHYTLLRGHEKMALNGDTKSYYGFSQPNNPQRILLISDKQLFLYDFKRSTYVWKQSYTGEAEQIGWQSNTLALLQTVDKHKNIHWYRLNTVKFSWQKCKPPSIKSRNFLRNLIGVGC